MFCYLVVRTLYIFCVVTAFHIHSEQMFPPVSWLPFHLVDHPLCCAEAPLFGESPLFVFAFVAFVFGVNPPNHCQHICQRGVTTNLLRRFFPKSFMLSNLTLKFLTHFWVKFCVCPASFFYMWLSSFPNTFIEETILSPLFILGSFVIN